MENIVIQVDHSSLSKVENLVASVCYDNHLAKYHAIVSVPVIATIQSLLQSYPDTSLDITCNHCRDGIDFSITIPQESINQYGDIQKNFSPIPSSDVFALNSCLVDAISVSNQTIRFQFLFSGISYIESERRKKILSKFYHLVMVES